MDANIPFFFFFFFLISTWLKQIRKSFKTESDISSAVTACGNIRLQDVPLFLGWVFADDFGCFLSDIRGSVRVLQLVHVDVKGHGVGRGQVLAEAEGGSSSGKQQHTLWMTNVHNPLNKTKDLDDSQRWVRISHHESWKHFYGSWYASWHLGLLRRECSRHWCLCSVLKETLAATTETLKKQHSWHNSWDRKCVRVDKDTLWPCPDPPASKRRWAVPACARLSGFASRAAPGQWCIPSFCHNGV